MQGLSADNAAAALRAVLPMQLRSFSVALGWEAHPLHERYAVPASSFWAAVSDITQLTELNVEQHCDRMYTRPELVQLSHLRKLTLGPAGEKGEHVDSLKQLTQLRELTLHDTLPDRLRLLCQPPHALQLESLTLLSFKLVVDETTMLALLHLPTLTALNPRCIHADAWPLLPQLPLLCRLHLFPSKPLTPDQTTSLCASLARCSLLKDLTLRAALGVLFVAAGVPPHELTAEQERAAWAALLSSVPHLRRLRVDTALGYLLPVLPLHLPLLEHLALSSWGEFYEEQPPSQVAHPNLRVLELGPISSDTPSEEEVRSWMGSERLPKLERYILRTHFDE
jgi:hypothetical protein